MSKSSEETLVWTPENGIISSQSLFQAAFYFLTLWWLQTPNGLWQTSTMGYITSLPVPPSPDSEGGCSAVSIWMNCHIGLTSLCQIFFSGTSCSLWLKIARKPHTQTEFVTREGRIKADRCSPFLSLCAWPGSHSSPFNHVSSQHFTPVWYTPQYITHCLTSFQIVILGIGHPGS